MGMSASQVRLLTLQDRKSTIGLRLGNLSTQKRMLNRQMTKLANEYNASFASKKLQWYDTINNDYTDITYANLMTPSVANSYSPYVLSDRNSGKIVLDSVTDTTSTSMNDVQNPNMVTHMGKIVKLGGVNDPNNYIPGSLSLNQDMEFYIIEDMIGVQNFNRYKMKYTPIKNVEKSYAHLDYVNADTLLDGFTANVGADAASHTTGKMYLYGNGDKFNYFNSETLWKSAYDSNAVVQLNPAGNNNTQAIVESFVDSLLKYKPIANLDSVSNMTQTELNELKTKVLNSVMKVVLAEDENGVSQVYNGVSNVDTVLDYKLEEDSDGNDYVVYYSDNLDDPIQFKSSKDSLSMEQAAVPQANATVSIIKVAKTNYKDNKPDGIPLEEKDASTQQYYRFISVANLMDVAMYYLSIKLDEGLSHQDEIYNIGEQGEALQDSFYPANYANKMKMSIYEAGEMSVPSMYSIYSNLNMLDSKLDNITDPDHQGAFQNPDSWNANDNKDIIDDIRNYIKSFMNGVTEAGASDLICLANINAWLEEAMTTESSNKFNEYIDKAYAMFKLVNERHYDLASAEDDNHGWKAAQQDLDYSDGFFYDKGVVNYNKREYLFSQTSAVSSAASEHDITSQLTADELNKFEFYKKLVKECLANGWMGSDKVNDKSYLDASLTNGKWLIDGDIASNSRRIFEVANDDVVDEAHSKYESQLSLVTLKEEKIDREMANLETQQNAINAELDSLKNIISDNIKSTFKMYV
ncbi:hypothetical protein IJI31_05205 [bacterium]|nr:hypothetical protein [bacterium]